jgi:hypothetical protein
MARLFSVARSMAEPHRLHSMPNHGLELTGNSVRSFVAPAILRSSGPAFGAFIAWRSLPAQEEIRGRGRHLFSYLSSRLTMPGEMAEGFYYSHTEGTSCS